VIVGGEWLLASHLDRRTLLKRAGSAVLALVAAGWGVSSSGVSPSVGQASRTVSNPSAPNQTPSPPERGRAPGQSAAASAPTERHVAAETVYVFNVGSRDVTLIDVATRQVRDTRPLGSSVRWLSNEQTYWDGARIWTYDFPNNQLQAIAIDPKQVAVTKTIAGLGKGPGHSLVVLPNRKRAAVNVAGDDLIAFLDLEGGQVDSTLKTGAFP
jgi:YVTN family beta-propeller protein